MDGVTFDRLTKAAVQTSRRGLLRALIAVAMSARLAPVRDTRAQSGGFVVLGGTCTTTADCEQRPPGQCIWTAVCGDNGFPSDGPLTCCTETCCYSDADCCGDLRCAPGWEGSYCQQPPFPTRRSGQICTSDSDCLGIPVCPGGCIQGRCNCAEDSVWTPPAGGSMPPDVPDVEAALAAVENFSRLEVEGQFDTLYDQMHPDAQRFIPREAVIGWYQENFAPRGPEVAEPIKVRIAPWTWEVTGQSYPESADVVYRQQFADGSDVRGEVRLVKDYTGNWRWFFGRDRAFVENQIERFVGQS